MPLLRTQMLDGGSLGKVAALHRRIIESLEDRSFLYHRGIDFFERLIVSDGAIVGVFSDSDELIAYAALAAPGSTFSGRPQGLGRLGIDPARVAFGAGCGVHPDHRGTGLMKPIVEERERRAAALGADFVTGVVAPHNTASLTTFHKLGYAAVGIHHDDDGENYLLLKSIVAQLPPASAAKLEIGLSDHETNFAILRDGRLIGLPLQRIAEAVFAYVEPGELFAASP